MTDNEIVKALGCCAKSKCKECSFNRHYDTKRTLCTLRLAENALDLISRQKTEIERVQKSNRNWRRKCQRLRASMRKNLDEIHNLKFGIARAKSDVAKELGYQAYGYGVHVPDYVFETGIDGVKSFVLEEIIELMRREAVENSDFFIINREASCDPMGKNLVGLKVYLPKRRGKDEEEKE